MTLLSIAQDVAHETKGPKHDTIIGNTDADAEAMLRYINKTGVGLMRCNAWNILRKERTYTTVSGEEQTSIIPADFDRWIPETFWDRGTNKLIIGPVGPVEWQGLKTDNYNGDRINFTWRGGTSVFVMPSQDAGGSWAYEYVSKNWAEQSDNTPIAKFSADTDSPLIDEELLIRGSVFEYLISEGQPWQRAWDDFSQFLSQQIDLEGAGADVMAAADIFARQGRHFAGEPKASQLVYGWNY